MNTNKSKNFVAGLPFKGWPAFTFLKEIIMSYHQLQRLLKDSEALDTFAGMLLEEGETELVKKIEAKKKFLDNHISSVMEVAA